MKLVTSVNTNDEEALASQFTEFDYADLTVFNDKLVMCSAEGLFEYGGEDDDGVDIDAWFELAQTDFGIANEKRLRSILGNGLCAGDMTISVAMNDGSFVDYQINENQALVEHTWKAPINRAQRGANIVVKFANIAGADFSVDSLDAVVVMLHNVPMALSLRYPSRVQVEATVATLSASMEIS